MLQRLRLSPEHIPDSLRAIAALGNWGRSPGNVQRDLLRYLGDPSPPKPLQVDTPVRIVKPSRLPRVANVETSFLLPHVEFAYLFARERRVFNEFMLGRLDGSTDLLQ